MNPRNVPWKSEWKAAGLDPGSLTDSEEALVPKLQEENEAFLARHPYQAPARTTVRSIGVWALPLAAAAAVLLFVAVPNATPSAATELERMKGAGDPTLIVYRQAEAGTEKLKAGAVVRPGDVLQVAYRVTGALQGTLLSLDGSGNVTVHLAQEGHSVPLVAGSERPLEFSYELDRAPRYEVFFLVVSSKPFDLEPIRQVLKTANWKELKAEAFGASLRYVVFPLNKDAGQ